MLLTIDSDSDEDVPVVTKDPDAPEKDTVQWLYYNEAQEAPLSSPINIGISGAIQYECTPLRWFNFDITPHKTKLTNTGSSVYLSSRYRTERPFISGGILMPGDKYIFSQVHFHWGQNMMDGSDHMVDGVKHPMEMQVMFFNSKYITPHAALDKYDGVVFLCYLIRFGVIPDSRLDVVIDNLPKPVERHGKQKSCPPIVLSHILSMFHNDYFAYWGTEHDKLAMWIVSRECYGATTEQVNGFRALLDLCDKPILSNNRPLCERGDRNIYFVNPRWYLYSSLYPIPYVQKPENLSVLSQSYYDHPSLMNIKDRYLMSEYFTKEEVQIEPVELAREEELDVED